jgi:hypothetical protein
LACPSVSKRLHSANSPRRIHSVHTHISRTRNTNYQHSFTILRHSTLHSIFDILHLEYRISQSQRQFPLAEKTCILMNDISINVDLSANR